jgi:hypothetical protein
VYATADVERSAGYFSASSSRCGGFGASVLTLCRTLPLVQVVTPPTVSQCPFDPGAHTMRPSMVRQSRPFEPTHRVTPLTELQLSVSARVGIEKNENPAIKADAAAAKR